MSDKPLAAKLLIKPGKSICIIDAPEGFTSILGELPEGGKIICDDEKADVVLFFTTNMAGLQTGLNNAIEKLNSGGILWVIYPKLSSKLAADINRDTIWQYVGTLGWTGVAMVSLDETWSGFRMKHL